MKKIILVLAILIFSATAAYADDRTITVTGYGEVEIAPDTANLNVGFSAIDKDLAAAKKNMTTKMNAVVAALAPFGIAEKDIKASQLQIYPNYNHTQDGKTILQGYNVSRSINIVFKDLTKTDQILDATIKAGANTFDGLTFTYSDSDKIKDQALSKAIQNATQQADFLAKGFGVARGAIKSINTMNQNFAARSADMMPMLAKENTAAGYQPGMIKISAMINVVFDIADNAKKADAK